MIETMQRAVNTALESEDVRDATGSLINSYGKCEIWLGKTTSIRFELLKKTFQNYMMPHISSLSNIRNAYH